VHNVIHEWADDCALSKRDRATLNQKLDRLVQMDYELAYNTKLLSGVIAKSGHIHKLVIHGDVMMRPMLCLGPVDTDGEYTLLIGAIEKDWKLDPHDCVRRALQRRADIVTDPAWRGRHERVPTETHRGVPRPGVP
jgi:hypothetical protein